MPDHSSKKKRRSSDVNQLAAAIVEEATSDEKLAEQKTEKNPAAVALGRLGGLRGGRARAEKLSPKRRSEIARRAAKKRWGAKK